METGLFSRIYREPVGQSNNTLESRASDLVLQCVEALRMGRHG
jgi:hypothetical protein